jgi:RHS repeat-associated protein
VYDAWGNLLQKSITKCNAEHLVATADAQNRIHVSPPDYLYDAAGNMTTDVTDGVTAVYDQENRVSTATSGGITTAYTYDYEGNRVRKSTGNLVANGTLYWYMSPGVVAETDLAGTTNSEYIFFGGGRVARRDGATGTAGVFYYFSDHLKTASVITDSTGVIKTESDYYPWGGELQFVNNDSNHYKFTGKERDGESVDYFGARYYSNGLGRWVSADWSATPEAVPYADLALPQTLNLYSYSRNNPLSVTDPDGHCTKDGVAKGAIWCFFHYSDQDALFEAKNFFNTNAVYQNGKRVDPSKMTNQQLLAAWKSFNDEWKAIAMTGANPGAAMAGVNVSLDKLQHIYDKHAGDFGLTGNKSPEQLQKLDTAIQAHTTDPDTKLVQGQYRGQDANLYYNSRTQNVVVTDKSNNVVATFKASPAQTGYINSTGRLN